MNYNNFVIAGYHICNEHSRFITVQSQLNDNPIAENDRYYEDIDEIVEKK